MGFVCLAVYPDYDVAFIINGSSNSTLYCFSPSDTPVELQLMGYTAISSSSRSCCHKSVTMLGDHLLNVRSCILPTTSTQEKMVKPDVLLTDFHSNLRSNNPHLIDLRLRLRTYHLLFVSKWWQLAHKVHRLDRLLFL